MTLKSRFFFVTATTTLAVALAVIVANNLTLQLHENRFLTAEIDSKRSIWRNIVINELERMQNQLFSVTRDPVLREAVIGRQTEVVRQRLDATFNRLWASQIVTKLQIADTHGDIVAAFPNNYVGPTRKTIIGTAIRDGKVIRGIERDDDGELMAIVAVPLYTKYGQLIGVVSFGRNLIGVLQRFMEQDASLSFIADRGGVVGLPVESNILPDVSHLIPPLGQDVYSVEHLHGRAYQVTILSVGDYQDRPLSHMVVFRDYTESFAEESTANYTSYAIIILMLVASVVWLYWFVVMESTRLHQAEQRRNQELAVTNSQLQEALRVKSDFLANMSHELRTPLNSVIGFSGALLKGVDGPLNSEQETSVQYVFNSGQHLLNLINDVLDISKIEAGKMVLNLETVDVRALILETVKLVDVLFRSKSLPLRVELADDIPVIYGDNTRIKQVLLNILSNAAKFTDKGEVVIRCRVVEMDEEEIPAADRQTVEGQTHWVLLSVKDSGIGINEADYAKVFEEFRQIDTGTARKYGGTGLGMAISKRIVEMHGGHIWLSSRVGAGTTFYFSLPHTADESLATEDAVVDLNLPRAAAR